MLRCTYFCLLVLLGQAFADEKISYKNYKVYKITPKNEEALKTLQNFDTNISGHLQYQFWKRPTKVGHEISLMVAPDLDESLGSILDSLDVDKTLVVDDLQELIEAEMNTPRTISGTPVNWKGYNTLDEINSWLEGLAVEFPKFVKILKPGKTHEGREIVGLKLDLTPSKSNKKAVFMESNIHAREWISSAATTWMLHQFLRSSDGRIKKLAEKYTWYFFPVMNPDGFVYTHTKDRLWRKTRTQYTEKCFGVDPNRNWGFEWNNGGSSSDKCSEVYAGPKAWSEPCVAVMRDFISSIGKNLLAYLNFHSFSQELMVPYGNTTKRLDNYNEMSTIGKKALDSLKKVHGTKYKFGNIAELVDIATGSSMDWVKDTFRTPIALTWELRDTGKHGFVLPADQIIPTAEETLESIITVFEEWDKLHPNQIIPTAEETLESIITVFEDWDKLHPSD